MNVYISENEPELYPEVFRAESGEISCYFEDVDMEYRHFDVQFKSLENHDITLKDKILNEIKLKSIHSKEGYMGKTQKGYYTIYAGTLEDILKGDNYGKH